MTFRSLHERQFLFAPSRQTTVQDGRVGIARSVKHPHRLAGKGSKLDNEQDREVFWQLFQFGRKLDEGIIHRTRNMTVAVFLRLAQIDRKRILLIDKRNSALGIHLGTVTSGIDLWKEQSKRRNDRDGNQQNVLNNKLHIRSEIVMRSMGK